ncbi:MAG: adenosylcobinamide-phosphate synthase CbiB [Gemmatimonadota bacterium]
MRRALVLGAALVLDTVTRQPQPHPVEAIGSLIARAKRRRTHRGRASDFVEGAVALGVVTLGAAAVAGALGRGIRRSTRPTLAIAAEAALLHPAMALDALVEAGLEVAAALEMGEMDEARRLLSWHLVSRDTTRLPPALIASAAVESMSENLCDSVVAPACAYLAAGLPGAWAYRVVNTADAMVGYRTTEFEWYGKAAARADDVLNLGPSRWTAALIRAASPNRGDGRWTTLPREARRAAGPNAGWPMAALALALDVRLEKPGVYVLNPDGRAPGTDDIVRAAALIRRAAAVGWASVLGCSAIGDLLTLRPSVGSAVAS